MITEGFLSIAKNLEKNKPTFAVQSHIVCKYKLCEITNKICASSSLLNAIEIDSRWIGRDIRFLTWFYYGRLLFENKE